MKNDETFMREALSLACDAARLGEIPVGAVVVRDGEIIGSGHNLRETNMSATAHAEVLAIEKACAAVGSWRLSGCTLYVTLEPCPMCAGAIVNSRIDRVVYGCRDAVGGACGSVINIGAYPFNHSFALTGGVLADESAALLSKFFAEKRKKKNI